MNDATRPRQGPQVGGGPQRERISPERKATIRKLYAHGATLPELVRATKVARRTLERIVANVRRMEPWELVGDCDPGGQRPPTVDPARLDNLSEFRGDRRRNGKLSFPRESEPEPCDDDDGS